MSTIGDVHRFVMTWNMGTESVSQLVYHRIHASGADVGDPTVRAAELTNLELAWTDIDNIVTDTLLGVSLEHLKWDFTNHRWDGIGSSTPTAMDGLAATDYVSHGVAALGKVITAQLRRQARKFIPGIVESAITGGFVTGASLVLIASFMDQFDTALTSGGASIPICTFNTDDTSPLYETASESAGTVIAEGTAAYQRRRRPGVGLT